MKIWIIIAALTAAVLFMLRRRQSKTAQEKAQAYMTADENTTERTCGIVQKTYLYSKRRLRK